MLYSIGFIPIAVLFGHHLIPREMMVGKRNRRCQNVFYKKIILLRPQQSQRFPCFVRTKNEKTIRGRSIRRVLFLKKGPADCFRENSAGVVHLLFLISFQQKALKGFHHNHVAALLAYLSIKIDLNVIFSLEMILVDHLSVPPPSSPNRGL